MHAKRQLLFLLTSPKHLTVFQCRNCFLNSKSLVFAEIYLSALNLSLTGRTQRVRVRQSMSQTRPVQSGVPQGSVLGPLLFLLFIDDVSHFFPPSAKCKLFADDLKSYVAASDNSNQVNVSLLLDAITDWSLTWQLPLSPSKCNWMIISNRLPSQTLSFTLAGCCLQQTDEVKDLGILFNSRLGFDSHITNIIVKAKQRIFLLKRSFVYSNSSVLVKGFKTYVLPILEHCSPVWSPSAVGDILRLESVQRSFTKSLPHFDKLSYAERLCKSGLCSLERRRLCADLILFYKLIHKLIESDLLSSITFEPSRTRGNSLKVKHLPARLNLRLNFYTVRTIRVWNTLPEAVVCSDSVDSFRRALCDINFSKFLKFE